MSKNKTTTINHQSPVTSPQSLITGNRYEDKRGIITFNNEFDASQVKRIYTIENLSTDFIRGWQGHKLEQRWFSAMKGQFEISVIKLNDFKDPSEDLPVEKFILTSDVLTYLHVPGGCITAIQSLEESSKLLVLADYGIGEINDEYRFEPNYFKKYEKVNI